MIYVKIILAVRTGVRNKDMNIPYKERCHFEDWGIYLYGPMLPLIDTCELVVNSYIQSTRERPAP